MGFAPAIASAATYTVSVTPTTVTPGGTITVNWAAPSNHSTTDWVSVYSQGTPNTSYNNWEYVPAGTNGTLTLTAPTATGTYEVRYLLNNGYTDAAKSSPIIAQYLTPEPPAGTVLTSVPPIVIDEKKDVVIRNVRVSNPNGSCIQIKNSAQNILYAAWMIVSVVVQRKSDIWLIAKIGDCRLNRGIVQPPTTTVQLAETPEQFADCLQQAIAHTPTVAGLESI